MHTYIYYIHIIYPHTQIFTSGTYITQACTDIHTHTKIHTHTLTHIHSVQNLRAIPILIYCCQVWNSNIVGNIQLLEKVQRRFTIKIYEIKHLPYQGRLRGYEP